MSPSEKPSLAVVGAGGHSRVVVDIIERQGHYRIAGILDAKGRAGETFCGHPVLGPESTLADRPDITHVIVAIGDNWVRRRVVDKLVALRTNLHFGTAVHPSAIVARDVRIGEGTVVMAGAVVNPGTAIGRHAIVNTSTSLDHDNRIGDFAAVLPGALTGGDVTVGDYAVLALGCRVLHGVTIGTHAVVGAGALVTRDVADATLVYGTPARDVRKRQPGDVYL